MLPPRRGAPVDRTDVVALDVVAQRVELGALSPDPDRGPPVELAQRREPRRKVLAAGERRQRADRRRPPSATVAGPRSPAVRSCGPSPGRRAGRRAGSGCSAVVNRRRSPAGQLAAGGAHPSRPAEGCHASRSQPRIVRPEVLVTSSEVDPSAPSRTCPTGSRWTSSRRGLTAIAMSTRVDGDADPDPEQDHLPGRLDDDGHHAEQEPAAGTARSPPRRHSPRG